MSDPNNRQMSLFDEKPLDTKLTPSIHEEYTQLVEKLNFYCNQYYDDNASDVSDAEYDALNRRLKEIEKENPEIVDKENSPSYRVGWKATKGVLVKHNVPMLSLQDVFNKEDVYEFVNSVKNDLGDEIEFLVETKIDGLSLALRYENGKLTKAITRGDGITEGEDVTKNAKKINDVVTALLNPVEYIEIRGEVYMTREAFAEVNARCEEEGKKVFANPRNCAAGTLRQIDTRITQERNLSLFIFNIQEVRGREFKTHSEGYEYLKSNDIKVIQTYFTCKTADEVWDAVDRIGKLRGSLEYDIDGAVVKINNLDARKVLGNTIKFPRWAIAYKYPPEEKETILRQIEVNTGRTGRVTPVAIFDPIQLCGTSVSRATLHNQDFIDELEIGIGDTLLVYKSGEIIPKIKSVIKEKRKADWQPYIMPSTCPVCGHVLKREEGAADLKCLNFSCKGTLEGRIVNFVSRDCMNIKGFGREYIRSLIEEGFVESVADIFDLKTRYEELLDKHVFGLKKNTDKILSSIEEATKLQGVDKVLASLGIPNVGKATSMELIRHYKSIDAIMAASVKDLVEVEEIGEVSAQGIFEFFHDAETVAILERLRNAGLSFVQEDNSPDSSILEGKTIVITGTFDTSRDLITEMIERNGGKVSSSVSSKTSFVLAGDSAGSKLTKAKELGIDIIDYPSFMVMLGQ